MAAEKVTEKRVTVVAPSKPFIGADTFPTIWIWICFFFNVFGILALIQLAVAEIIILTNNFNHYIDQYGHRYRTVSPLSRYLPED